MMPVSQPRTSILISPAPRSAHRVIYVCDGTMSPLRSARHRCYQRRSRSRQACGAAPMGSFLQLIAPIEFDGRDDDAKLFLEARTYGTCCLQ